MIDKYNSTGRHNDNDNVVVSSRSMSEFHFRNRSFSCTSGQEIYRSTFDDPGGSNGIKNIDGFSCLQNPRKKRSKLIKVDGYGVRSAGAAVAKPKYGKKPDPDAPKITKPCSECGKKFWSWKALFGHMRCHPERQWRGINPPPTLKHHHDDEDYQQLQPSMMSDTTNTCASDSEIRITAEDHEIATCLLMLANGPCGPDSPTVTTACNVTSQGTSSSIVVREPLILTCRRYVDHHHADISASSGLNCGRFECSSCKKVFGSHQALGGHRASHKNVKGCFAIHRNEDEEDQDLIMGNHDDGEVEVNKDAGDDDNNNKNNMNIHTVNNNGHKCSICLRVFSSGQALGGHKRCHWEKSDDPLMGITPAPFNHFVPKEESWGLDLNLPAPVASIVRDDSLPSSAIALDLKLGL